MNAVFSSGLKSYEVINGCYRATAMEKNNYYLRPKGKGDTIGISDRPSQSISAHGDSQYS